MKYELTSRRLREALADNQMKPQELADASGVNKSSISQYINGSHAPSNTSSGKIAAILNVSPLWLMGFDAPKHGNPAASISSKLTIEEESIILAYRKAPELTKDAVANVLGVKREGTCSESVRNNVG